MIKTLLGTKGEMSSKYDRFGRQMPVTSIAADSNVVLQLKEDKVAIGFGKKKKAKKPQSSFVKTVGYAPRFIREITQEIPAQKPQSPQLTPQSQPNKISIGDKINVSIFEVGDLVKITGTTRGKGFAGGVKRWGFAGGPKTHGQSDRHRAPGSIGAGTTPGRVFKGKKMAGHMGAAKLTVTNLEVVEVNPDKNYLLVKGSVPGSKNGLLIIQKTGKAKAHEASEVPKVSEEKDEGTKESKETNEPKETKAATTEIAQKSENSENQSARDKLAQSTVAKEEQNANQE